MAQQNQIFLENCKKDQQYQYVYNNMTLPYFCGLLQTDGHFTVMYGQHKGQDPRIILTHSNKDYAWIYGIKNWLKDKLGILSNLPSNDKAIDSTIVQPGLNLVISHQQARNFLNLIDEEEKKLKTPLLFDKKRVSFFLVKESIRIKSLTKGSSLTQNAACLLVDIKRYIKLDSGKPEKLTSKDLIKRLGFENVNTNNFADSIYQAAVADSNTCGSTVLANIDPNSLNSGLAQFILGVMEGDGSYAIGLFTHVDENNNKISGLRPFDIVPLLTVTSNRKDDVYLFAIIDKAFGSEIIRKKPSVPKSGSLGIKIQIKNRAHLKQFAIPFFDKYQPTLTKNKNRYKIFKRTLEALPDVYYDQQEVIKLITEIYNTDIYERSKTLEEYLAIVKQYYD